MQVALFRPSRVPYVMNVIDGLRWGIHDLARSNASVFSGVTIPVVQSTNNRTPKP
jgi:hypothetical protein